MDERLERYKNLHNIDRVPKGLHITLNVDACLDFPDYVREALRGVPIMLDKNNPEYGKKYKGPVTVYCTCW